MKIKKQGWVEIKDLLITHFEVKQGNLAELREYVVKHLRKALSRCPFKVTGLDE
jgi:hypothetical protein